MCGITGVWQKNRKPNIDLVRSMNKALAHRGPDDETVYFDPPIMFGHRRLAIIDLVSGDQPMSTLDQKYTIIFNGEIYNYIELKQELEQAGLSFRTTSDTEVLLQAYVHWGDKCLTRLLGMFAFAIWNREEQSLFIARDRLGQKPLVYFWDGKTFAFASELKALLQVPGCEPKLNAEAVELYLALGYVPAPLAIFQKVKKLQPGHYLKFKDRRIDIRRYWFPEHTSIRPAMSREERLEEFKELFRDTVRLRLRSDVPVGIFLSGGIDSSAVALEVAELGHQLMALSVVFDQDQTDLPYAVEVAKQLGLEHKVIEVGTELRNEIEQIFWQYDEPFADTSNIPSFYIASIARKYCKVVLNGDGGDEVFGGYRHYEYISVKQKLKGLACALRLKDGIMTAPWQVYLQSKVIFRCHERATLLKPYNHKFAVEQFISEHPFLISLNPSSALQRALLADRHIQLANDYLFKTDIALSGFGVEGRSPFLDHRLLEWAQGLNPEDLVVGREKKVLLREALRGRLPHNVLDRPKHGFGSPINYWLKGSLLDYLHDYLPCPLLEQSFQKNILQKVKGDRTSSSNITRLWLLFVFAVWARQYKAKW